MIARNSTNGSRRVHDTDPDEPRNLFFAQGCLVAFALALLAWIGMVSLIRWFFEEGF